MDKFIKNRQNCSTNNFELNLQAYTNTLNSDSSSISPNDSQNSNNSQKYPSQIHEENKKSLELFSNLKNQKLFKSENLHNQDYANIDYLIKNTSNTQDKKKTNQYNKISKIKSQNHSSQLSNLRKEMSKNIQVKDEQSNIENQQENDYKFNLQYSLETTQVLNKINLVLSQSQELEQLIELVRCNIQNMTSGTKNLLTASKYMIEQHAQVKHSQIEEKNFKENINGLTIKLMDQSFNLGKYISCLKDNFNFGSSQFSNQFQDSNGKLHLQQSLVDQKMTIVQENPQAYDRLVCQLDHNFQVLKRVNQLQCDLVQYKLNENANVIQMSVMAQFQNVPQFVFLHGQNIVIDSNIYSLVNNEIIFKIQEEPISGCVLDENLIAFGFGLYGKIKVVQLNFNGKYSVKSQGSVYRSNGEQRKIQILKIQINKFEPQEKTPIRVVYFCNEKALLFKLQLNTQNVSDFYKEKISFRCEDFEFVDRNHVISMIMNEFHLINIKERRTIKVYRKAESGFYILPSNFDINKKPFLIHAQSEMDQYSNNFSFLNDSCKFKIIDIIKQGEKHFHNSIVKFEGVPISDQNQRMKILGKIQITSMNKNQVEQEGYFTVIKNVQEDYTFLIGYDKNTKQNEITKIYIQ